MMKFATFVALFDTLPNGWWMWFSQVITSANPVLWQWMHKVWVVQGNTLAQEDMVTIADQLVNWSFFLDDQGNPDQDKYDAFVASWVDDA